MKIFLIVLVLIFSGAVLVLTGTLLDMFWTGDYRTLGTMWVGYFVIQACEVLTAKVQKMLYPKPNDLTTPSSL